jgi:hypothetical protein
VKCSIKASATPKPGTRLNGRGASSKNTYGPTARVISQGVTEAGKASHKKKLAMKHVREVFQPSACLVAHPVGRGVPSDLEIWTAYCISSKESCWARVRKNASASCSRVDIRRETVSTSNQFPSLVRHTSAEWPFPSSGSNWLCHHAFKPRLASSSCRSE